MTSSCRITGIRAKEQRIKTNTFAGTPQQVRGLDAVWRSSLLSFASFRRNLKGPLHLSVPRNWESPTLFSGLFELRMKTLLGSHSSSSSRGGSFIRKQSNRPTYSRTSLPSIYISSIDTIPSHNNPRINSSNHLSASNNPQKYYIQQRLFSNFRPFPSIDKKDNITNSPKPPPTNSNNNYKSYNNRERNYNQYENNQFVKDENTLETSATIPVESLPIGTFVETISKGKLVPPIKVLI